MTIRPRLCDISSVGTCEEFQLYYPAHLTPAEVDEMEAWLTLMLRKIRRIATLESARALEPDLLAGESTDSRTASQDGI